MTISIDLAPEAEARLHETAAREGENAETFAAVLLAEALEERARAFAAEVAAIQEGLDAAAAGRERPVEQYISELRARHGKPASWPASTNAAKEVAPGVLDLSTK